MTEADLFRQHAQEAIRWSSKSASASQPRLQVCLKRNLVANESQLCTLSAMERRETTVNEHWTVKAVFAFVLTCLVGAEVALYSGLPVLPSNWPWRKCSFSFQTGLALSAPC
jgi:hypothetical protein